MPLLEDKYTSLKQESKSRRRKAQIPENRQLNKEEDKGDSKDQSRGKCQDPSFAIEYSKSMEV